MHYIMLGINAGSQDTSVWCQLFDSASSVEHDVASEFMVLWPGHVAGSASTGCQRLRDV